MAKKQKGSKKRTTGSAPARPLAVLYHLDPGTERGDAVRAVLAAQDIHAKTVTEGQLGNPVGALVGLVGFRMTNSAYAGDVPEGEFMLLHNVSSVRMNELLAAMRAANASVGCKAQVTQHNRLWPLATLVKEVSREHAAMSAPVVDEASNS